MTDILIIIASVIVNLILYLCFGALITKKKGEDCPLLLKILVGFFFYYFMFFIFCVPPMKYYRPLSMLTNAWVVFVAVVVIVSLVLNGKGIIKQIQSALREIKEHPLVTLLIFAIVAIQIVLVSVTYNFTLDAAYYVANVSTCVETNMINVYDPFTGAWQDHFEMRYFFATYSCMDAVVCQLTGIPALIWTKSVMAITIIVLTNMVYFLIAEALLFNRENQKLDKYKGTVLMMAFMFIINITFTTVFTSALFLMTRTYEGKAIVGNLALIMVFYLFIRINDGDFAIRPWLLTFIVCFGATTVSSSANMLLPVELTVLFLPMIVKKKRFSLLPKYIACVIPGVVFALTFVLYVKGYFVFYTYPR